MGQSTGMAARVSNHGKKEYGLGLGPILGMCATQRVAVLLDLITAYCKPAAWLSFTYSEGVQIGALGERKKNSRAGNRTRAAAVRAPNPSH